jgi:RHS repeat-associated protein
MKGRREGVANTYDNIGQLKLADSTVASENRGYLYDAAWNLNKRTNNATVYTFNVDVKNQLTSGPAGVCSYDSNGNLEASGVTGYAYDAENQLTNAAWIASDSLSGQRSDFTYDGRGRLRKRVDYSWQNTGGTNGIWSPGGEVRYVYDGMRVIQERSSANTPMVSYVRGSDLSGTLEGAGGIGGLLARSHNYVTGTGAWNSHGYYHADGGGNITYLANPSQGLAASYKYDPFGNAIALSGTNANANVYRFSSKEYMATAANYYYGYRFYDPSLQRWINRDPLGDPGSHAYAVFKFEPNREIDYVRVPVTDESWEGPNLYGFVNNKPVMHYDANGLFVFLSPCTSALLALAAAEAVAQDEMDTTGRISPGTLAEVNKAKENVAKNCPDKPEPPRPPPVPLPDFYPIPKPLPPGDKGYRCPYQWGGSHRPGGVFANPGLAPAIAIAEGAVVVGAAAIVTGGRLRTIPIYVRPVQ